MKKMANREVADVNILEYATKKPFLFFDTANETGLSISGDTTYAMAKGQRAIAFDNPSENTFTISAQVAPFKLYAMFSDGTIDAEALFSKKDVIKCETAGELPIPTGAQTGTVFVYKNGEYGETDIEGTYDGTKFTATETANIAVGKLYEVGYLISKTDGVHKISFNDDRRIKDYVVTMLTNDKTEDGVLVPKMIHVYKAKPQKNLSLTFSSTGDPATIEMTFDALRDTDGNIIDIVEIDE